MTTLLITDAALLDVEAGTVHPGSSVRVEGERIVDLAPGRVLDASPEDQVVEARGRTLMPGLIDAHVHAALTTLDLGALARRPQSRIGIEAKNVLEAMLRRGFTTVRDAGGLLANGVWHGAWPSAALNAVWLVVGLVAVTRLRADRAAAGQRQDSAPDEPRPHHSFHRQEKR